MDFEHQKCPIFVGSLQNPAASNQKDFYTKITQNSSVYLGFDAEVPQKILQGHYSIYYKLEGSPLNFLSTQSQIRAVGRYQIVWGRSLRQKW